MASFEKGGYIKPSGYAPPQVKDMGLELSMETVGFVTATAAIALGLNEREAVYFCERAYQVVRGQPTYIKYRLLIEFAYEIKQMNL